MKNKGLILTLVALSSLLVVGCNKQSNEESFDDSTNDKSDSNDNNQALYNRIILDYYEQRICNKKTYGTNMYSSTLPDNQMSEIIELQDVELTFIVSKTDNDAYLIGVNNSFKTFGDMFYYGFNDMSVCIKILVPDVWYKGKIYYLTDAYYLGIIGISQVDECMTKLAYDAHYETKNDFIVTEGDRVRFDSSIDSIVVDDNKQIGDSLFGTIRSDLFNQYLLNDESINNYDITLDDIHIFQSFACVGDAACVSFSIDGIMPPKYVYDIPSKSWDIDFDVGGVTIQRFQNEMPIIYKNHRFYPIDEAFLNGIIGKDTTIELLRQYAISAKQVNYSRFIW